jgi:hypothetical protein
MLLMQPSRFKFIEITPSVVKATKLLVSPNHLLRHPLIGNSKFRCLCVRLLRLITLASSLLFSPYQKDEWSEYGGASNKEMLFLIPEIKCLSLLPDDFLFAPSLLLSFLPLSVPLFGVKR